MNPPSDIAVRFASQAWCTEETKHIPMDTRLATAFARILDAVAPKGARSPSDLAALKLIQKLILNARITELAERLVTAGPKAAHVSASETHEITDFILEMQEMARGWTFLEEPSPDLTAVPPLTEGPGQGKPDPQRAGEESHLDAILSEIRSEVLRARRKHEPMNSPHEGYAVILEEVDELWEEVKKNNGRELSALEEAAQVSAMGVRYILDLSQA